MNQKNGPFSSLHQYSDASEQAAGRIIRVYSTSFGAATQLLGPRHRTHVKNIYALVRIADELVDGVAAEAGLTPKQQLQRLDSLESETLAAVQCGFSSNPIVHAFAASARLARIDSSLIVPFFTSMRMDLETPVAQDESSPSPRRGIACFDEARHENYVYGSAEVVGLMCLRVFLRDEARSETELKLLEQGARDLGAAFQNVNFLRDLADDTERLARNYLSDGRVITEQLKLHWTNTIREQLEGARQSLPLLPLDARVGVDCARRLFARLTDKLEQTPIEELRKRRIRVSNPKKALLVVQSIAATRKARAT